MSKNIYFDLDDVICDTTSVIVNECNNIYDRESCLEDVHSFNLQESLKLTEKQHLYLMDHIHNEDVQMKMLPIEGAISTLNNLSDNGYGVYIITGRPPSSFKSTKKWLELHGVLYKELIYVNKYNRNDTKKAVIYQLSFDELSDFGFVAVVEDSPEAVSLAQNELACPILFFIRPWNKKYAYNVGGNSGIHICHNWSDINNFITKELI